MRKCEKEYALYKGDNLITMGTIPEIAAHQNVKEDTIRWLASPTNEKRSKGNRKILVPLD